MSGRLPILTPAQMIRALNKAGFEIDHHAGSHAILLNADHSTRTVVPVHSRDISRGLMKKIIRQAGLTDEEFRELI